jgi:hypothetical protein
VLADGLLRAAVEQPEVDAALLDRRVELDGNGDRAEFDAAFPDRPRLRHLMKSGE